MPDWIALWSPITPTLERVGVGIFLAMTFTSPAAWAGPRTIVLYRPDGSQVANYGYQVRSAEIGDTVILGPDEDEKIVIDADLSTGNATRIWVDRLTGDVFRVPKAQGLLNGVSYLARFDNYIEAFKKIAELVPTERLPTEVRTRSGRYIRQKRYKKYFDLDDFANFPERIPADLQARATEDLPRFARDLARLKVVGDTKLLQQFVFTDSGWKLTDADLPVYAASPGSDQTVFDRLQDQIPRSLRKVLRDAVFAERVRFCFEGALGEASP